MHPDFYKYAMIDWSKETNCAVTVCNTDGTVIYANNKSKATFAKYGELVGRNLKTCHSPASWEKIQQLLQTGGSNAYTIHKNGIRKMIYQTAWFQEGVVAGLVEYSMEIPEDMPHYDR